MKYNLASLAQRQRVFRRRYVTLPVIEAPKLYATDLFISAYRPIVNLWAAGAEDIIASYERALSELITDSPDDVADAIEQVNRAAVVLSLSLTPQVRRWALKVETYIRERWSGAVLSATGVRLDTMLGPADMRATMETYIQWNVGLIKGVSDQARHRITNHVFAGLQNRTPAREVAKQIREAVAMSRRRSILIASDQLNKISNELADERSRDAGLTVWRWNHSGKKHPRLHHLERNGFLYSDVASEQGKRVGGVLVRKPPESTDLPGRPPWCGCVAQHIMVFDFDEEDGK